MANSEPGWQEVLELMYDQKITSSPRGFIYDFGALSKMVADNTDMEVGQAKDVLTEMREIGLLTIREPTEYRWEDEEAPELMWGLSEQGFEVELQTRQTDAQLRSNRYLAVFTAALVMISITEAVAAAPILSPAGNTITRMFGAVTIAVMLMVAWLSD